MPSPEYTYCVPKPLGLVPKTSRLLQMFFILARNGPELLFHKPGHMRIIVLCGSTTALPGLNHLSRKNYLSALIYSQAGAPQWWLPLETWAAGNGLPCWQVGQDSLEDELSELVREINPDLVIAYNFPYTFPDHLAQPLKLGAWHIQLDLQEGDQGRVTIRQLGTTGEATVLQQEILLLPAGKSGSAIEQLNLLSLVLLQTAIRSAGNIPGRTVRLV